MADFPVSVTIVTYNSALFVGRCLDHLLAIRDPPFRVVVVDNASTDETPEILATYQRHITLVINEKNNGFAGGQNQAIRLTTTPWVLTLNPDVRVTPDFVRHLLLAGALDGRAGVICGKLRRMRPDFEIATENVLDSTGIYFTPELRHFDRGSEELENGRFSGCEYVFGATGAAALYRREMIEDVALNGEFFDEDFFAYREDADLAWRAQLLGWRCIYTPDAVAYHVRSVLPADRRRVSAQVNYHSVKNRFLMRINNIDYRLYLRHLAAITWRDLLVFGGCLVREPSSLPAFWYVIRNWTRCWEKRRWIQSRRRVPESYIAQWFARVPVAFPIEGTPR